MPAAPKWSFCESVAAGPLSRWHIRQRSADQPLKLGGGIQTASLCGHPKADRGWDLEVPFSSSHFPHCCPKCVELYNARAEP
jgi:hypothetical protein